MPTTRTNRTSPTTTRAGRTSPTKYITLLAGTYDDDLEYILTDEDDNAIFVYDSTGYPVIGTIRSGRDSI